MSFSVLLITVEGMRPPTAPRRRCWN